MRYPLHRFVWLFFILVLTTCAPRPSGKIPSESYPVFPSEPGDGLVSEADRFFDQGLMEQALKRYLAYAVQFPEGRYMDRALWRIGRIHQQAGRSDEAESYFQRLLSVFANSSYADEARLAIIDLLAADERRDEALSLALSFLESDMTTVIQRQLRQRLVDLYRMSGDLASVVLNEYLLYATAAGYEKERWREQMVRTISQLDVEAIAMVWERIKDNDVRGLLAYRFAVVQTVLENYDDALEVLTAFQKSYPQHASGDQAAILLETLSAKLRFQPLTVGCLLPLSGPYKLYGARALNGVELALSLMHDHEGVLPLRLVVKDSGSDDAQALRAVRELSEAGVGAILGPIITAPAAAREAQKLHIPMITFTQKPEITSTGDFIFRHFITPQSQAKALVDYFINAVGLRDFAILYPNETYGETFMSLFWDEVILQGGRVVGAEAYEGEQTDFAASIKKLVGTFYPIPKDLNTQAVVRVAESPYFQDPVEEDDRLSAWLPDPINRLTGLYFQNPYQDRVRGPALGRVRQEEEDEPIIDFDVLFIPDAPNKAGLIIPQLAYYDITNVYLAGTNLWHSPQLIEMSRDYVKNAIIAEGFFKDSRSESVIRFVDTYQNVYGKDPGILEAFAFDSASFVFELMMQPNLTLRNELRDALLQVYKTDGITGPLAFDQDGEALTRLSLLRVRKGRFEEIANP